MKKLIISVVAFSCISFMQAQVTEGSKLQFTYDVSGNQELRDIPGGSGPKEDSTQVSTPTEVEAYIKAIENKFVVSPNPTTGAVTLQWEPDMSTRILSIELVSIMSSKKTRIKRNQSNAIQIDLSTEVSGLYLVTFYLRDKNVPSVQKKIIKM